MEGPISKGGYHENRKGASKWAIGVPIKYVLHSLVFNYSRPHNVAKSWIYFNTFGTESKLTQKKQQQQKNGTKQSFDFSLQLKKLQLIHSREPISQNEKS